MIDPLLVRLAFRTRAATLVVATTGSATLAATATGYTRSTGSFVADGFLPGMELVPAGFTQTTPAIVGSVSALALTVLGGRTVDAAAAGRSLTVGLPSVRKWELDRSGAPDPTRPYVAEAFVPGPAGLTSWPAQGGRLVEEGLSVWQLYALPGYDAAAIDRMAVALKTLFAPGTVLSLSDSTSVRLRTDVAASHSEIRRVDAWALVTVTLPWRTWTRNVIAA